MRYEFPKLLDDSVRFRGVSIKAKGYAGHRYFIAVYSLSILSIMQVLNLFCDFTYPAFVYVNPETNNAIYEITLK